MRLTSRNILIALSSLLVFAGLLFFIRFAILGGVPETATSSSDLSKTISSTLASPERLSTNTIDGLGNVQTSFKIDSTKYFADKQWVMVHIISRETDAADPAYLVLHKQPNGRYNVVLGPGTDFDRQSLRDAAVPDDLSNALIKAGVVSSQPDHLSDEGSTANQEETYGQ